MHKCRYETALKCRAGKLWLHAVAVYKAQRLEVFKVCEDGRSLARNLYFKNVAGYYVSFPGESFCLGYGCAKEKNILEPWGACNMSPDPEIFGGLNFLTEADRLEAVKACPVWRYIFPACGPFTVAEALKLTAVLKAHPRAELLIKGGFINMAQNKAFFKMSEKAQRPVLEFLRRNPGRDWSLRDVLEMLREGITPGELEACRRFATRAGVSSLSYPVYKYIIAQENPNCAAEYSRVALYRDYIKAAKLCGHDVKDNYWKFPRDLRAAHNKVMAELENVKAAEEKERAAKKQAAYLKAVKKWLKAEYKTASGVRVWIPETVEEIAAHAKALNQCLVSCDYIAKVARRECLLVFIARGSVPMATAEILKGGKLGQFYGNEKHWDSCAPSKAAKTAFESWKEKFLKKVA